MPLSELPERAPFAVSMPSKSSSVDPSSFAVAYPLMLDSGLREARAALVGNVHAGKHAVMPSEDVAMVDRGTSGSIRASASACTAVLEVGGAQRAVRHLWGMAEVDDTRSIGAKRNSSTVRALHCQSLP